MSAEGALAGIRVLDLGVLVQGPYAAQALADLGADVVKVELPGVGDYARWVPAADRDRRPPFFLAGNRGKRSICIDLRTERGAALLLDLVEHFDVVVSNFTPGTMERWGLGYAELAARNPRLVVATASAFGGTGPDAERPGLDLLGQAAGGFVSATGPGGGCAAGVAIADHVGSLNLTVAVLAALLARTRTGRGQQVGTSLVGGMVAAQAPELVAHALTGEQPTSGGRGHPILRTMYGVFATRDGAVAITRVPDRRRVAFWRAVGRPDVAGMPELTGPLTAENRVRLSEVLDEALGREDTAHWCSVFRALEVDHAPVRSYADVLADPAAYEQGLLQRVDHPRWGCVTMPGSALSLSDTPVRPAALPPGLGEHTDEVLASDLGLGPSEVAELRAAGVI